MRKDDTHKSRSVNMFLYDAHDGEGLGGNRGSGLGLHVLRSHCVLLPLLRLGVGRSHGRPMA